MSWASVVQIVQLDPADRDGKSADHYKSSDVPAGHRALPARGISKLALYEAPFTPITAAK